MKKLKILVPILIAALASVTNFYACNIDSLESGIRIGESYHFETKDGDFSFVAIPSKGRDIAMMERHYAAYLAQKGIARQKIYRTFMGNPLKRWIGRNAGAREMYQYPFRYFRRTQ